MNLIEIFSILIIHFIADFVLQTDWQAKNKSKSIEALMNHTITYSCVWLICGFVLSLYNDFNYGLFFGVTLFFHSITDYFTSRWVKKSFDKQDYHNGFIKIGFDQYVLHLPQLFLTYYFLTK